MNTEDRKRRRPRFWVGAIVCVLAIGLLLWSWLAGESFEPQHQGRGLSEWLVQLKPNETGNSGLVHRALAERFTDEQLEARAAIQALGTNQLPVYLEMMRSRTPALAKPIRRWLLKWNPKSRWVRPEVSETERMRGAMAIHALGDAALPVKLDLISLFTNRPATTQSAHALAGLGPEVIPDIVGFLNHPDSWTRLCTAWILAQQGSAARGVVTNLETVLNDSSSPNRHLGVWALGCIGGEEDWLVTNIRGRLEDRAKGVRRAAIDAVVNLELGAAEKQILFSLVTNDVDSAVARLAQRRLAELESSMSQ